MKLSTKYLIFLVVVPALSLLVFFYVANKIFIEDKITSTLEIGLTQLESVEKIVLMSKKEPSGWTPVFNSIVKMDKSGLSRTFIFRPNGEILAQTEKSKKPPHIDNFFSQKLIQKIQSNAQSTTTFEGEDINGKELIICLKAIPERGILLLLSFDKSIVLRATYKFIVQSFLIFLLLISLAVITSWYLSKFLSSEIEALTQSVLNFGKGDLSTRIKVTSNDEIGQLGNHFNQMAENIEHLLDEQKEKALIVQDLEVAQIVQETLLPPLSFSGNGVQLSGAFLPAHHCSGDFYHYFQDEDYFFFLIADATGHGVPAALMTSAANAVVSAANLQNLSLKEMSFLINSVIHKMTQAKMNLTLFLSRLNLKTGEFEYIQASHEPPILIKPNAESFEFLDDNNNPRIGQEASHSFTNTSMQLQKGDRLFLYTDGLFELCKNKERGACYSDRDLVKALQSPQLASADPQKIVRYFENLTEKLKEDDPLKDDITFFAFQWT